MPPLLLTVFSGSLRLIGRGSRWQLDPLATLTHRRYRLSDRGPINHLAGLHSGNPSRLRKLPLHSTMHLRSRCSLSSLRDSRSHLVRGSRTSQVLASSVAKMATMPGSVPRTNQLSPLNRRRTLGLSGGPLSRRKCPADSARCISQMLSKFCSRSR